MWRFTISFDLPTRLWVASIGFTLIGAVVLFALPHYLPKFFDDPIGSFALRALGWTFLGLGLSVVLPMLWTLFVARGHPGREDRWHWWINFLGGLAGVFVFAVPATLVFPAFMVAWLRRPNTLFPEGVSAAGHLWLGALFSTLGVVTLVATFYLGRWILRHKNPRRESRRC